jgi:hypothetical protein
VTSINAIRDAIALLARFFPSASVGDETIDAYADRARQFKPERVRDVVERWVDAVDHWPAWSELRKELMHASRVPTSLAEHGEKSELHRRTEERLIAELEAKATSG